MAYLFENLIFIFFAVSKSTPQVATRPPSNQPQSAPNEQHKPSSSQPITSSSQPKTLSVTMKATNAKSPVPNLYVNNVPFERKRKISPSEMNFQEQEVKGCNKPTRGFEHAPHNQTADTLKLMKRLKANEISGIIIKQEQEKTCDRSSAVEDNSKVFRDSNETNMWSCGQCCRSFAQRAMLQIHVCPRSPKKPYKCGHCSETFAFSNELRTHVVTHTNEKPFKCGFCSRTFAGATTLNNHIRTHTGEKPFLCDKCGRNFSQASQLSRHQRLPSECYWAVILVGRPLC